MKRIRSHTTRPLYSALSVTILLSGLLTLWCAAGRAVDDKKTVDPQAAEFFEASVRPVLFKNCFTCHGEIQQMAGLRLDSRMGMSTGSRSGPVVVPGDPEKSALIQAIRYTGKVKMPPTGRLKDAEIEALTAWVRMGAPWPESIRNSVPKAFGTIRNPQHWSFQPVKKPALPKVKNRAWCASPIDYFVLAKLEQKGLTPAPRADKRTLIRRAYFDLIGLPPTAEEVAEFYANKSPDAFAKVVDRLLASPRYGERWGRYWLDVARYADTKGYLAGTESWMYPNAYTYRDYVIRAFNEDLPYDRFIIEQLAADRLPLGEDTRPLAALGLLTVGRRFLNDPVLINDDRIDVTMRGLNGLTVGCARCHDHKFDPIPTRDYYSLYGVFASTVETDPPPGISPKAITVPYEAHNAKIREADKQENDLIRAQVALLRQKVEKSPETLPMEVRAVLQRIRVRALPEEKDLAKLEPQFEQDARDRFKSLQETIAALQKTMPPAPEFAMAVQDAPTPVTPRVFIRGNPGNPGPEVPRQFLQILAGEKRKPFTQGSGRLELAQAIASKDNPLTARVMVNRIWLRHFGFGLVRTPSDFGTRGEPPTHPELLDWLAATFMSTGQRVNGSMKDMNSLTHEPIDYSCGWSIKKLHRLIMLSSAYQQSSAYNPRCFAADPENRLLWRMNRRRLDLEALRDSLLYVAGRLDTAMGGPSVELTTAPFSTRRTVYGFIDRQNLQGMYRTFDFASPDTSSAQRYTTTVPQQALFMMNSPFVVEQAQYLAKRVLGTKDNPQSAIRNPQLNDAQRIRLLYRLIFARTPAPDEIADGQRFLRQVMPTARQAALTPTAAPLTAWEQYIQVLLMTNAFCFVD